MYQPRRRSVLFAAGIAIALSLAFYRGTGDNNVTLRPLPAPTSESNNYGVEPFCGGYRFSAAEELKWAGGWNSIGSGCPDGSIMYDLRRDNGQFPELAECTTGPEAEAECNSHGYFFK